MLSRSWIGPALDIAEDRHPGLGLLGEPMACQEFALECGEEALTHGIVVGIAAILTP